MINATSVSEFSLVMAAFETASKVLLEAGLKAFSVFMAALRRFAPLSLHHLTWFSVVMAGLRPRRYRSLRR